MSPYIWLIEAQFYHDCSKIVGAFTSESKAEAQKSKLLQQLGKWKDKCEKKKDWSSDPPHPYAEADRLVIHKLKVIE